MKRNLPAETSFFEIWKIYVLDDTEIYEKRQAFIDL